LALSSALSEVSEFVMPSEWHVSPTEPLSRAAAPGRVQVTTVR
jgi:hypothetical protein